MFASEKVRRQCFSGQEFQPVMDVHELLDKTKVSYWYKLPHEMLQHHVRFLFCRDDFFDVSGIDITVGGNHGKGKSLNCFRSNYYYIYINLFNNFDCSTLYILTGKFRMILKLIIRYSSNREPLSRLFHLASVEYKDDIKVLKDAVLDHIGNSLKLISDGGKLIVDLSSVSNELKLSFSSSDVSENDLRLCDVSICLFITGDLKFYAQM